MRIYVVMGTCGEFSDRIEWPVRAFDSSITAQDYAERATQAGRTAWLMWRAEVSRSKDASEWSKTHSNPLDADMEFSYWDAPTYFIYEVDFAATEE